MRVEVSGLDNRQGPKAVLSLLLILVGGEVSSEHDDVLVALRVQVAIHVVLPSGNASVAWIAVVGSVEGMVEDVLADRVFLGSLELAQGTLMDT